MQLRNLLNLKSSKALVRKQLVPGRVIHHPVDFGDGPQPKFVILAATREEHFLVFVINSCRAKYIKDRAYLLNQQVIIDVENHSEFLNKNSWVNCSKLRPLRISDVESRLAKNPNDVKCCISEKVKAEILGTVQKFGSLSNYEKAAVLEYLGR